MSTNIIKDALEKYDRDNEKYENLKKKIKYIRVAEIEPADMYGLKLVFYDKNKEELFRSRIEILGKYFNSVNTWIWGWALSDIDKAITTVIRKVFLYGTDINIGTVKNETIRHENILLKNELITSRFRIDNDIQIDIHCAIASYLSKKPFIFVMKEFLLHADEYYDVKKETWSGTNVTYYLFILDPPQI
jgi:hypothetical protein